jgi:ribosomal small subunit protein bTHX
MSVFKRSDWIKNKILVPQDASTASGKFPKPFFRFPFRNILLLLLPVISDSPTKITNPPMGKGDFKSKKGKINRGSHGKNRPKLKKLKTLLKKLAGV